MKAVQKINHVTLAVKDLKTAVKFYTETLGLTLHRQWDGGAYLTAGHDWICFSVDPAARNGPHADYTHMAFDVSLEDFHDIKKQCLNSGARQWKENRSEGESFYFLDPDGHKLEIHVGDLHSRLAHMDANK